MIRKNFLKLGVEGRNAQKFEIALVQLAPGRRGKLLILQRRDDIVEVCQSRSPGRCVFQPAAGCIGNAFK